MCRRKEGSGRPGIHSPLTQHTLTKTQAQLEAAKEAQRMATATLLIDTFTQHVDLPRLLQVGRLYDIT